jgi:CRISPR-associated protein Cmr3
MSGLPTYLLRPHAPLVFRSGKPFEPAIRDEPQYPSPAAWAGLMRTCRMDATGESPQTVRALPAHGALLARCTPDAVQVYVPRPADAYFGRRDSAFRRLLPHRPKAGQGSDLDPRLWPVMSADAEPADKPGDTAPFWSIDDYLRWAAGDAVAPRASAAVGLPPVESRVHVRIDRSRDAAEQGQLFRTEAWDCGPARNETGFSHARWCFVGRGPEGIAPQLVVFGGERRLSWLATADPALLDLPADLARTLTGARGIALSFATPALFDGGWCPGWLDDALEGKPPGLPDLHLQLIAICVPWWQPISGWDLLHQRTRPTRRAVPAGATYWFRVIAGDPTPLWLQPISDADQDRRDGFGLSLIRPWQFDSEDDPR